MSLLRWDTESSPDGKGATLYTFRERFHLGDRVRIAEEGPELVLTREEDAPHIVSIAALGAPSISTAADLALKGEGFEGEVDAAAAAEKWSAYLQFGLARRYVGAEFGDPDPEAGTVIGEYEGRLLLKDAPGRIIYATDTRPSFSHLTASGVINKDPTEIVAAVQAARDKGLSQSLEHRVAFDLFGMSFSSSSYAGRLVILMMAAETLIKQKPHPPEVAQLVDGFLAQTDASDLPAGIRDSLKGSLARLKEQSVGQAARELASIALGGHTYQGLDPARFFTKCYNLRSQLVHGDSGGVELNEINLVAAHLEVFVGDLLSAPILNDVPD